MANTLPVPHRRQLADGYCLAACAQMVLAYLGVERSQDDLARQLGIRPPLGAPASNIARLKSAQLDVVYSSGSLDSVSAVLARDLPVIAFVQAGELPFWRNHRFQHAIVIVGLEGQVVSLLDPAAHAETSAIALDEFTLAWQEMDFLCATLARR